MKARESSDAIIIRQFDCVVCRMDDGETLDQAIEAVTGGNREDSAALRAYAQGGTDAIFSSLDGKTGDAATRILAVRRAGATPSFDLSEVLSICEEAVTLRSQLAEAVGLLRDARIALTYYAEWTERHVHPCKDLICKCDPRADYPRYPAGRDTERAARAFLARLDKDGE